MGTGLWVGGRIYENEFGEPIFIELGLKRNESGLVGPLRYRGDGVRDIESSKLRFVVTNPIVAQKTFYMEPPLEIQ